MSPNRHAVSLHNYRVTIRSLEYLIGYLSIREMFLMINMISLYLKSVKLNLKNILKGFH
jgi:hypothetical protein